ncbi:MAG: hypothetical protein GY788_06905 [bacterium]|nr:hypothetical protein [bacterium]
MSIEYDDLPHWEFSVVEVSPGCYRVRAVRDGGIHGEGTGADPDNLLPDLKRWAQKVESELANGSSSSAVGRSDTDTPLR